MKKVKVTQFLLWVLVTAFGLFIFSSPTQALDRVFLTISPPINELILNPGSRSTSGLTIYNNSDSPVIVDLRASEFYPRGEKGEVDISDEPLPQTKDWVTVYPQRVKIEPKKSKVVSYTISLPQNAPPGGFYFAIVASSEGRKYQANEKTAVESGTSVVASVAELVLVRVSGPVQYAARITHFDILGGKRFLNYGPVTFDIKVENLSNVHSMFSNTVLVSNYFFPEKYKLNLKSERILPQAVRDFRVTMPNKWHFGYYKATVLTTFGGGNNMGRTIVFWIVPVKEMAVGAALISLVVLLVYLLIRRSKKQAKELAEMQKTVEKLEEIERKLGNQ